MLFLHDEINSAMNENFRNIRTIIFDADDTLWENEGRFRAAEREAGEILKEYVSFQEMSSSLYSIEVKNMPDYGFGAMAFTLSMLENAVKVSGGRMENGKISGSRLTGEQVSQILEVGRGLLHNPATPFAGVKETLLGLRASGRFCLACFTKGDLLDQGHKLDRSGLRPYFDYIKITSDKTKAAYSELFGKLGVSAREVLSVGNSFKSDIAPVLEMGGSGIYIPAENTWQLEKMDEYDHDRLFRLREFSEILALVL